MGLHYELLGGVRPNPRLGFVREGVKAALAIGADMIIGVGGGSAIDTAKAIAHGAANPETDIWDFWLRLKNVERSLPVGAVLTVPAAGSETSDSAVISNETAGEKRRLEHPLQPARLCYNESRTGGHDIELSGCLRSNRHTDAYA
jgi:alcohol dehydrogenase YqhD (iron-dependent ADH family)